MISFYDLLGRKTSVTSATPLPVAAAGGAAAGTPVAGAGNPQLVAGSDGTNVRAISVTTSGIVNVSASNTIGNVASGVADSGNPVKVGAKYNLTPVTFASGQRTDLQSDANGYLKVVTTGAGTDASGNERVVGTDIDGAAVTASAPVKVGGTDGTNIRAFRTNSSGHAIVSLGQRISVPVTVPAAQMVLTVSNDNTPSTFATAPYYYDGTQQVVFRGDAAGGLFTQEKERGQFYAETGGVVAASAFLNGTSRDGGSAGGVTQWANFQALVRSIEGGGTVTLQGSDDGAAWTNLTAATAVPALVTTVLSTPVFFRYHRAIFANGATAQTAVTFKTRYAGQ